MIKVFDERKNTNSFRFVLLLLALLNVSCVNDSASRSARSSQVNDLDGFKNFIEKFEILNLPFIANTGCFEPDSSLSVPLDMDTDSIFIGYIGPAVTIGMLPDSTNYYAVLYCTASACYMPVLAVYSKNGILQSKKDISKGCGAGVGYTCSEVLTIDSSNDIKVVYTQESFDVDNLGNEVNGTRLVSIDTYNYSIGKDGIISVDSIHNE